MKCGRLTGQEVSDFSEAIAAILKKNPNSAALVIAPYLTSENVAGYRAELRPMIFVGWKYENHDTVLNSKTIKHHQNSIQFVNWLPYLEIVMFNQSRSLARRWEDKFDARGFKQHAIAIRCAPPSSKRRVPLHFDGWVLMMDVGSQNNMFSTSQLISDRPIWCLGVW